ncbi:Phytosulfokines 3 [Senna tora]|uniref:Phytosulfokine n=1 Tax=Senna tora TaxID=362788 RepID=A0A834SYA2_9FABA|nr:Phytosulfokines 3 [Senna tora]
MSSKRVNASLCFAAIIIFFLMFFNLTHGGRPIPSSPSSSIIPNGDLEAEESCEGIGEEECLMRRTLTAHLDYIYTQKHKP